MDDLSLARTHDLVLLIDDNAPIERLITLVLGGGGYDVISARSGREALEILEDESPSLILCDLQLPDISGFDVLRSIRANERFDRIPVVAFTVPVRPEDVEDIQEAGFAGYIEKPIDPDAFLTEVASYLID